MIKEIFQMKDLSLLKTSPFDRILPWLCQPTQQVSHSAITEWSKLSIHHIGEWLAPERVYHVACCISGRSYIKFSHGITASIKKCFCYECQVLWTQTCRFFLLFFCAVGLGYIGLVSFLHCCRGNNQHSRQVRSLLCAIFYLLTLTENSSAGLGGGRRKFSHVLHTLPFECTVWRACKASLVFSGSGTATSKHRFHLLTFASIYLPFDK